MKKITTATIACLTAAITSCAQPNNPTAPHTPYTGAVPIRTTTPVDAALVCLAHRPEVKNYNKVFGVHVISDQTQRYASEEAGGFLPRDSAGMLVSLLQKAGVKQVNRSNTAVSEWEIAKSREQVLGDGKNVVVAGESLPFRPLMKGAMRGSDFVIDGAITQLDFNTYSGGLEATVGGVGGGARTFAVTAAVDLRVTDTRTTRIVKADSYSKQAVGHEVSMSVFRFFSSELFDIKIGDKSQEGIQAAIRWVLAEAAYNIVTELTKHDGSCDIHLPKVTQELRKDDKIVAIPTNAKPKEDNDVVMK